MNDDIKNIVELIHRLLNKAIRKEMVPRVLDSGEKLYRIELHVIVAIGEHPEINLTELANILGVTKGAVSQKAKLLERKGYIERYRENDNKKEIRFELTQRGNRILKGHEKFHRVLDDKILKAMGGIDEQEISKLISIFKIFEEHLETL